MKIEDLNIIDDLKLIQKIFKFSMLKLSFHALIGHKEVSELKESNPIEIVQKC
jgi:hypothetical protein